MTIWTSLPPKDIQTAYNRLSTTGNSNCRPPVRMIVADHWIRDLGAKLGFHAEIEVQFPTLRAGYSPLFDVVWFLDTPPLVKRLATQDLLPDTEWKAYFHRIPIAAFEIEGSTTTSKNQVGNFANLSFAPSLFKFAVVINSAATCENDTYRRGVKIYRTLRHGYGDKNIIFVDWSQLSMVTASGSKSAVFNVARSYTAPIRGSGGETDVSVGIVARLGKILADGGLFVDRDVKPCQLQWAYSQIQTFQNIAGDTRNDVACGRTATWNPETGQTRRITKSEDFYYTPKLDIVAGFRLPQAFTSFLSQLSRTCSDSCIYPLLNYVAVHSSEEILFPFVSIEVENGISKHLNGGILNMSAFSFIGLLVSRAEGGKHLEAIREYSSVRNVFYRDILTV